MRQIKLSDRTIETKKSAFVMGIVNATPDSFWEKSRGGIEQALKLIDEGADIIDLGAESTRPGAEFVDENDEINRLLPVLRGIRQHSSIPVSIDTRKASVFKACLDEGADILNDVSALEDDEKLAGLCAAAKVPVVLMHWNRNQAGKITGKSKTASLIKSFSDVDDYLKSRVEYALKQGISSDKIIIDPGIGFNKNTAENLELIANCGKLCNGKFQVLMALSRKTVIGDITLRPVEERLSGTLAANLVAVQRGASILRVHDVKETVDGLKMLDVLTDKIDLRLE